MAKREPNPDFAARRRVVFSVLALCFVAVAARALQQQVLDSDFLSREGNLRYLRDVEIPASRGMITDRHGEPLAISTPVDSVWANPSQLEKNGKLNREALKPIAKILGSDVGTLLRTLEERSEKGFVYLARRAGPEISERIRELGMPEIGLQREYRRYYPNGEVTTHLVGFTDVDDHGQEGLERSYEDRLRGIPGIKRVLRDGHAQVVQDIESVRAPQPGHDLALSIDRRIQFLAYRELKTAVHEHKAVAGSAIVVDVATGEVLALVNQPSYNPNGFRDTSGGRLRNRAITDVLEPGSTMKPFTVAAGLELGRIRPNGMINTSPGVLAVGRNRVRDHHNLGLIDVATVLVKSSNVGATRIALQLTPQEMWAVYSRLGFGRNPGSGFPGEAPGLLAKPETWSRFEQATMSFGYGMNVSLLHLAQAYSVIASDGVKRPLSLLKRDRPPEGERVLKPETARAVRSMLEGVASVKGTARAAAIEGYRVSGKTGTARKAVAGGYSLSKYQALFAGMAPATNPRLVMVVMVDEPGGKKYYGGLVAAPVFSKVMSGALRLLNVPPDALEETRELRLASLGARR